MEKEDLRGVMIIKKVMHGCINAFFIILCICVLVVGILWLIGIKPYIVSSGSMEPIIKTGSLIFVDTKYNYDEVEIGDIVAFEAKENVYVTHRVINKQDGKLETKGDNNEVSDGLTVSENNFKGVSKFWIPQLGYLIAFLQSTRGKIIAVTFMLVLFILDWL